MKTCIIASSNEGKLKELREMLKETDFEVFSLADVNFTDDIEETGLTFRENAEIKAKTLAKAFPEAYIIADDSGLSIDLLDGMPGVYSARFAGYHTPYPKKFEKIWEMLKEKNENPKTWSAAFICDVCFIEPSGKTSHFQGRFEGLIASEAQGEGGFGYDPIFFVPEKGKTAAMLKPEEKNACSHRGKAMQLLKQAIWDLSVK